MASVRKHRNQWFISRSATPRGRNHWGQSFHTLQIGDQTYLHHDRDLTIREYLSPNVRTLLLGVALGAPEPGQDVKQLAGRFVAVENQSLVLDATGSMGVFYSEEQGDIVCGSSQKLLAEVLDVPLLGRVFPEYGGVNWDPLPLTRITSFKRMFFDQKLNLVTGEVSSTGLDLTCDIPEENLPYQLADVLLRNAELLIATQRPIWVALTGGTDSRTVFGALVRAGVEFTAFTMILDSLGSRHDSKIAKALCARHGIPHVTIRPQRRNQGVLRTYIDHSGGLDGDRGKNYAAGYYYREIPENALVLHGGSFEVGQLNHEAQIGHIDFTNHDVAIADLKLTYPELGAPELAAFRHWLEYRSLNPIRGMDNWVDLFFIDQRRGGWGADNRQAEDCFGFDWLIFANTTAVFKPMLAAPEGARRRKVVQIEAMEILCPGLYRVAPINPTFTFWERAYSIFISARARHKARQKLMKPLTSTLNRVRTLSRFSRRAR